MRNRSKVASDDYGIVGEGDGNTKGDLRDSLTQ